MKFVSVTADLPRHETRRKMEVMYYITRIANPMLVKDRVDFEDRLLNDIRGKFGDSLEISYFCMSSGEICDPMLTNRVRIHLTDGTPTVH